MTSHLHLPEEKMQKTKQNKKKHEKQINSKIINWFLLLARKKYKGFSDNLIILGLLFDLTYLVTVAVVSSPLARHFSTGAPDCIFVV